MRQLGATSPAEMKCFQDGGFVELQDTPAGQVSICVLPDGTRCNADSYFRGECSSSTAGAPGSFERAFKYQQRGLFIGSVVGLLAYVMVPQKKRDNWVGLMAFGPIMGVMAGGILGLRKAS